MTCWIWKLQFVLLPLATNLLPRTTALYEALGHLCLTTGSDTYKSLQPKISYKAVPYPIVTNTTNITLTCTGRTVDYLTVPYDQSYMSKVEIRKNNKVIRSCRRSIRLRPTRNVSCEVSVWGVNDNDKFMCLMYASKAPCNGAQLSFEVQNASYPTVSRLYPTLKYNHQKIACIGSGVPQPSVAWLLNGSTIIASRTEKGVTAQADTTKVVNLENATNTYHVYSTIVVKGGKLPLHVQCVVSNEMGSAYSQNLYILRAEAVDVKLTTATIRWYSTSQPTFSLYNVSLKSGNKCNEIRRQYNKSNVTLSNLTMAKLYTVKVTGFAKNRDFAIATVMFYLPEKLPKPKSISFKSITSRKVMIGWEAISVNATTYGVVVAYKIVFLNKDKGLKTILVKNCCIAVLPNASPMTKYSVNLRGFSKFGDGRSLQYNFTTLDVIPTPQKVKVTNIMENSVLIQWTMIEQKKDAYDTVAGYTISVRNDTYIFQVNTSSNSSSLLLESLSANVRYWVAVAGRSEETEGMRSEWISFKTKEFKKQERDEGTKQESDSTAMVVILAVAVVVGTTIFLLAVIFILCRKR